MNWFNDYRKSIIIVILLAVFAMEGLVQAATITVGPARGNYDFNKIQNAIDAAEDGDEVLVAPKEYDIIEPITFRGKAITVRSEAGPYGTTIQMSEVPEDWETDYALVLFNNEEDSRSQLEGFTIKDSFERGITCINSSPRIENCMFISNLASGIQCLSASPIINNCIITGSEHDSGINCRENSSPTITNCTIWGNIADGSGGGGIYCNESSPTIIDCNISENEAGAGGGVECVNNSSPTMINCTISDNYADVGGGMHTDNTQGNSHPTLSNCTFSGNEAFNFGGGMYNEAGSCPALSNCIFSSNSAALNGGGMYNGNSSPTLINCTFSGNYAESGGGMGNDNNSNPELSNCVFSNNFAERGGGVDNDRKSGPILTNCTFSGNEAFSSGGGMCNIKSQPTLSNCTLSGNSAQWNGGGISNSDSSSSMVINCIIWGNTASNGAQIYNEQDSSATVSYSCVQKYVEPNESEIQGLISHWQFDEGAGSTAYDSASNNHGIIHGEAEWTSGTIGGALYFNGYNNYVSLPIGSVISSLTNSTITTWVNWSGQGNSWQRCWDFGSSTSVNMFLTINTASTGTPRFAITTKGNQYEDQTTSPDALSGGWHHLAVTIDADNSTHSLYIDGELVDENTSARYTPSDLGSTTQNWLGRSQYSPDPYFDGRLDDVRLYDRALSDEEIKQLYPYSLGGQGNIDADPMFVAPDSNDFHLKSSAGRWDPYSQSWVIDDVSSPCIDTGDPNSPVISEPYPNGITINMGAYGGTAEASKSPSGLHAKYGGGTGEFNNPYQIYTTEHLNTLSNEPNDYDKHFVLMADVNMFEFSYDRAVIAPDTNDIEDGFQGPSFAGVFDGKDHTISNLTIQGKSFLGLFGKLAYGAIITNLGLEVVDVNGTGDYIGGLVGFNNGNIWESHTTGEIRGNSNIGGLVGENYGYIIACNSNSTVNGTGNNIGGLIGYFSQGIAVECYCKCNVSGWDYIGGLIGFNDVNGVICMNYSIGSVTGNEYVGGLVACNYGSIEMNYSKSTVTADSYLGGLVGENYGSINNCYSRGLVIGNDDDGGLIGFNNGGSITNSFWDMETSGQSTSDGGTGKTTAEMQTQTTFTDAGWDFVDETINGDEDIWWIKDGDYPHLRWEPRIEPYQMVVSGYVDITNVYQELEGFGAFVESEGWLTAHPLKDEICDCIFGQLGLDIYKLPNFYDIDIEYITNSTEIIEAAQLSLGHPIKIMITSFSPPEYLKSNSDMAGGGTLARSARSGEYRYDRFAEWWADSLLYYSTYGITADYISIQNEPAPGGDWVMCKFTPTETTDYAGYNIAFETVYQKLNSEMNVMPKMLAPDTWGYDNSQEYIDALIEPDNVYGFSYGEGSFSRRQMEDFAAKYGHKPLLKGWGGYNEDEDPFSAALNLAELMNNSLVYEDISSFIFSDLFWGEEGSLVTIDNPWEELNPGYTINPIYYAFKQYSAFTDPGWHRVEVSIDSDNLLACAFISPNADQLSVIIINTSEISINLMLTLENFITDNSGVYRTSENENAAYIGTFDYTEPLSLPAQSITTINLVD